MTEERIKVRLACTDFPGPFNSTRICQLLDQRFDVVIDEENPDYVIFSVFSHDYLRYPNAVRIFFTGENLHPDFNLCDYAFGYDWLEFGDRYQRCPNYVLYDQFADLVHRRRSDLAALPADRRFCNFIYTNSAGHPFRDEFFHQLSGYRQVDAAGAHLRNTNDAIGSAYQGDWSTPKVKYQRGFKFSIAFENSSTAGYTTEKIVHALAADTIPIYWGNPIVAREFNTRRFINCHDFSSPDAVIERVAAIDGDDALYRQILSEPFFPNDQPSDDLLASRFLDQFEHIFRQPKDQALRRNLHMWGARYENERRDACRAADFLSGRRPLSVAARVLYRLSQAARSESPREGPTGPAKTSVSMTAPYHETSREHAGLGAQSAPSSTT